MVKFSITGSDIYSEKIKKFDDRFDGSSNFTQYSKTQFVLFFIIHTNKYSVNNSNQNIFLKLQKNNFVFLI